MEKLAPPFGQGRLWQHPIAVRENRLVWFGLLPWPPLASSSPPLLFALPRGWKQLGKLVRLDSGKGRGTQV